MYPIIIILFLALLLICMLFHVPIVISGAHTGLELWYESVLPSILPFMIITSLLLHRVRGKGICYLGLFCGLPVGANLVNQQCITGQWTPSIANALLCVCNITSPMFISGYILNQTFRQQVSPFLFFLVIYLPLGLYGLIFYFKNTRQINRKQTKEPASYPGRIPVPNEPNTLPAITFEDVIKHSLQVILMVGIYIMLFCILIQFLLTYLPENSIIPKIFISSLEITNGIHLLITLPLSMHQKTALIAGLTSFGGICSILQTKSVLTDNRLSMLHYFIVKLCMGILSYTLALLIL